MAISPRAPSRPDRHVRGARWIEPPGSQGEKRRWTPGRVPRSTVSLGRELSGRWAVGGDVGWGGERRGESCGGRRISVPQASVRASAWHTHRASGPPTVDYGMETVWLVFELNHEPPAIWISSFERQAARNGSPQLRGHTAPGVDGATICWVVADDDAGAGVARGARAGRGGKPGLCRLPAGQGSRATAGDDPSDLGPRTHRLDRGQAAPTPLLAPPGAPNS